MIPAGHLAIPADAADFPGRWQQLRDGREDRLNDEKEGADSGGEGQANSADEKNSDDEIDTRAPPVWRPKVDPRTILAPPIPEASEKGSWSLLRLDAWTTRRLSWVQPAALARAARQLAALARAARQLAALARAARQPAAQARVARATRAPLV